MRTEITPESLRTHAKWARDHSEYVTAQQLDRKADQLEREQRPLPTVPGWYPTIVVERGGESCTGALLTEDRNWWCTAAFVDGSFLHRNSDENTIRWAEQDGKTPGQTAWEAQGSKVATWMCASPALQAEWERIAQAVLAAHGTPTLTPVVEHPEPGTRGLLPVVLNGEVWCCEDPPSAICGTQSKQARTILAVGASWPAPPGYLRPPARGAR